MRIIIKKVMKVEIWSDVMCPFCYIGKRKFENALEQFAHKDEVEVVWKSFQLNPDMKTEAGKNINQYLAEAKGWSIEKAKEMNDHVSGIAKDIGLTYHLDKAVVANSFDAHRFSHLAKKYGKQNDAEEKLFEAYFTDGKNTADHQTLVQLGSEIGMDATEISTVLSSDEFTDEVNQDIYEAQQVSVRGVPFFVLGEKYAISGAQESSTFLQALNKTWEEINSK
jgi:predicted DsbA family dithiol-disulfide isomerase